MIHIQYTWPTYKPLGLTFGPGQMIGLPVDGSDLVHAGSHAISDKIFSAHLVYTQHKRNTFKPLQNMLLLQGFTMMCVGHPTCLERLPHGKSPDCEFGGFSAVLNCFLCCDLPKDWIGLIF